MEFKGDVLREEVVKVITKLVKYKTTQDEQDELKKCCNYIARYFKDDKVFIKKYMQKGVPSILIATNENPKVVLNAHFDVVPATEDLFSVRVQGNMIFGRGVYDDKGPLAILMVLMKEMANRDKKHDFGILLTGDEEVWGRHGIRYVLEQEGFRCDFAVVVDGGGINTYVARAKGILRARLIAKGLDAHGSRPWLGDNAVEKLIDIYPKIKKVFKTATEEDSWHATISLSKFHGGDADNKVPGHAELVLDIRYTTLEELEDVLAKMRKITGEYEDITFKTLRFPPFSTDKDNHYVKKILDASQKVFGEKPEVIDEDGGSDATFFSMVGIPAILTRPRGGGLHSDNEYLDLESIEDFYKVLRAFVMKID